MASSGCIYKNVPHLLGGVAANAECEYIIPSADDRAMKCVVESVHLLKRRKSDIAGQLGAPPRNR